MKKWGKRRLQDATQRRGASIVRSGGHFEVTASAVFLNMLKIVAQAAILKEWRKGDGRQRHHDDDWHWYPSWKQQSLEKGNTLATKWLLCGDGGLVVRQLGCETYNLSSIFIWLWLFHVLADAHSGGLLLERSCIPPVILLGLSRMASTLSWSAQMHNNEPVPGRHYILRKPGAKERQEDVTSLPESTKMWFDQCQKMNVMILMTYWELLKEERGMEGSRKNIYCNFLRMLWNLMSREFHLEFDVS